MSIFQDKFHLTPAQSLFLAKKKWDENVYCEMKRENRAVTFPQTQTILNGVNVPNVHLDNIQAILNMRDAWKFLLNTVDEEEYMGIAAANCLLNRIVNPDIPYQYCQYMTELVLRSSTIDLTGELCQ